MARRYLTENIINCRDLGGYACRNGETAFGKVIRCGVPIDPSESDIALLKKLGIRTVIDLRGDGEAEERPSYFINSDFDYHQISLLEANPAFSKSVVSMPEMYKYCLKEYGENFAKVFRLIASLDEPFIIQCFFGKDRTGLVSAVLLGLAGVSREDIIADYEVSHTYMKPFYTEQIRLKTGLIWEHNPIMLASEASNMEQILDYFESEFGGFEKYLEYIGLSEEEIKSLCKKLKNNG